MNTESKVFNNILVVLDAQADNAPVLTRAKLLCQLSGAHLSVLISCYDMIHSKTTSKLDENLAVVVDKLREDVRQTLGQIECKAFLDDIVLTWLDKTSHACKKLVDAGKFDLIIKTPFHQEGIKRLFKSGLDNYFVSECKVPVWMINPRKWDDSLEIVACIDLYDESHDKLMMNKEILRFTNKLSSLFEATMHVTDCYFGELDSMRFDYNQQRGFKREATIKERHLEKLKLYVKEYQVSDENLHVEEGIPDDALPLNANTLKAELAVIGNNEDSSVLDKVFGDTAVSLSKRMPCDLLILKPLPEVQAVKM